MGALITVRRMGQLRWRGDPCRPAFGSDGDRGVRFEPHQDGPSLPVCCASVPRASTRRSAITIRRPAGSKATTWMWREPWATSWASKSNSWKLPDSIFAALEAKSLRRRRQPGHGHPGTPDQIRPLQPYALGEGVITWANDSITSLWQIFAVKKSAQSMTSNWTQIARDAGAQVESVDGFTQAIALLNQKGRVDATVNDSIAVYAYLAKTGDTSVKIAAQPGKAKPPLRRGRTTAYGPDLNRAIDELRADGTLTNISEKCLKANVTGAPVSAQKDAGQSTWRLISDNLVPLAQGRHHDDHATDDHQLHHRWSRSSSRWPDVRQRCREQRCRLYISIIRGTPLLVQLFIVFALPELDIKIDPFPAAVIAFSLNVGGYAAEIIRRQSRASRRGQWEAAQTIGMGYVTSLRRIVLPQAAGRSSPLSTHSSPGEGHVAGVDDLVTELLRTAQIAAAPTFEFFAMYGTAAAYYWVICLVPSLPDEQTGESTGRYVAR